MRQNLNPVNLILRFVSWLREIKMKLTWCAVGNGKATLKILLLHVLSEYNKVVCSSMISPVRQKIHLSPPSVLPDQNMIQ